MPFSGPQGQGPFEDHSDCVDSMADEEGIDDPDAICAVWERRAEPEASTKLRFDELSRQRLLQAAVDHPDLVGFDPTEAIEARSARPIGIDVPGGPVGALTREADDEFDPWDPPEEYREAIEADTFVIYGKASVENYDELDTRFSVDALEDAIGRFFDSQDAPGIISRGHSDVVVGMPVREHTLESDTRLQMGGETYGFEAGETIRSKAKDADGDEIPELWLASRLANDTDIARETRYQALIGELNGYSVTIKPKEGATRQTAEGEDVLALDLHAVTVGTDEQILNKESKFDVAEFRAQLLARADDAAHAAEDLVLDIIPMSDDETQSADSGEDQGFMARILPRAADDTDDEPTSEQRADEDPEDDEPGEDEVEGTDPIDRALEAGTISAGDAGKLRDAAERMGGDPEPVIEEVAEGNLDTDRAVEILESAGDYPDDEPSMPDEDGDEMRGEAEGDEPTDDEPSLSAIADRLDDMAAQSDRLDAIEERLDELSDGVLTEDGLVERLEAAEVDFDEELVTRAEFDEVMQRAVGVTPTPTAGETDDSGPTVRESLGLKSGGD